ncbi:MAG TPA: hypothetical protein VH092_39230 [Urbifossiella sp.]|jgi:hypothetical protein|nr:hypothetical protein [Urbifossiella sp.]
MAQSFWPDFRVNRTSGWVRPILVEAGRELKDKTGGLVELRPTPYQNDHPFYPFGYECHLVVPEHEFVFLLFRVRTNAAGTSAAIEAGGQNFKDLFTPDGFREALTDVLHSERTQQIVQNLLSMAAA